MKKLIQSMYDRVLSYAAHPKAEWVLFAVAFIESSVFPIPPDVLLIPMIMVHFDRAFRYAFICTAGSVLGGIAGYGLGYFFYDTVGAGLIALYGAEHKFEEFRQWYADYDVYIVAMAGITPMPYKVVTVASGLFQAHFINFVAASAISRAIRFFLIAWLMWKGGPGVKAWIEKNLYALTMAVGMAFILLVVFLKAILGD